MIKVFKTSIKLKKLIQNIWWTKTDLPLSAILTWGTSENNEESVQMEFLLDLLTRQKSAKPKCVW